MRAFKLTLEYDGAAFFGWQLQPGQRTVQGVLEEKLGILLRQEVRIHGAGRTDAGVHALGQVAHFHADTAIDVERLRRSLCGLLPRDVSVVAAQEVDLGFHARRSATGKVYRYTLLHRPSRSPLLERTAWHHIGPLDRGAMRDALSRLVGEHDFASFCSSTATTRTTVRRITHASMVEEGELLSFEVAGTGFLKQQVRSMVGTVVEIGEGRGGPERISELLRAPRREDVGRTAPAHGLVLVRVEYGEE